MGYGACTNWSSHPNRPHQPTLEPRLTIGCGRQGIISLGGRNLGSSQFPSKVCACYPSLPQGPITGVDTEAVLLQRIPDPAVAEGHLDGTAMRGWRPEAAGGFLCPHKAALRVWEGLLHGPGLNPSTGMSACSTRIMFHFQELRRARGWPATGGPGQAGSGGRGAGPAHRANSAWVLCSSKVCSGWRRQEVSGERGQGYARFPVPHATLSRFHPHGS